MSDEEFRRIDQAQARRQRIQDEMVVEWRRVYETYHDATKAEVRAWLEQACKMNQTIGANLVLHVQIHDEQYHENDEPKRLKQTDMSPTLMLLAMDAWDKGEPFIPSAFTLMSGDAL